MNLIAIIILITVITTFFLNFAADYLNLKMLQPHLPDDFQGLYDADRYKKSQEYLRINTRFGWIASILGLIVMLFFWFGKGFPFLDNWVRGFVLNPIWRGLLYMESLFFARRPSPFLLTSIQPL